MQAFLKLIQASIPQKRLLTDALSLHAYAHDASHYVLIPKLIIRVDNEAEVQLIVRAANQHKVALTFRAAGTSLSGQAITDSVLVVLNENWRNYKIHDKGESITLQTGVIGSEANLFLAPFRRKIGPDPASIASAKIGGIAANNASGMCCGTVNNSYHTLKSIRLVFADGSVLDSADKESIAAFRQTHHHWLTGLLDVREAILADQELFSKIRRKYSIKNTVGYSLNAFIDFSDPIDILAHLMIGSEGSLGFISEITYNTVPDYAYKKAALFYFKTLRQAAEATQILKYSPAAAIEILDSIALDCAVSQLSQFFPAGYNSDMAALLIDVRAESPDALAGQTQIIYQQLVNFEGLLFDTGFMEDAAYRQIWSVREGIFTIVATQREPGTLVLIEDIAVPVEHLAAAVDDLKALFDRLGFSKTSIFGHARDGNLHFVMALRLEVADELRRYELLMNELSDIIIARYQGSLKAEHGTGRNMAPFVEVEWGKTAYQLMWQLKQLIDPHFILNPDVILSKDPVIHLKNLKSIPILGSDIDRCIECGYCEKVCPARDLTLSPRQRIVGLRSMELARRSDSSRYRELKKSFEYQGAETCAATGMCGEVCPVGINTGQAIKDWRATHASLMKKWAWKGIAHYHAKALHFMKWGLKLTGKAKHPLSLKSGAFSTSPTQGRGKKLVLFPSCGCRLLDSKQDSQIRLIQDIVQNLGYEVIIPDVSNQCCGLMYSSEGLPDLAQQKQQDLNKVLMQASENGKWTIITENASCALELQGKIVIQDIWTFIISALSDYPLKQVDRSIMLHVNCSVSRLKEKEAVMALAKRCASNVIVPPDIYCCGFAGSKGFTTPELNKNALKTLSDQIPEQCLEGYTCLQNCEIGLSKYGKIPYYSLLHLIRECML